MYLFQWPKVYMYVLYMRMLFVPTIRRRLSTCRAGLQMPIHCNTAHTIPTLCLKHRRAYAPERKTSPWLSSRKAQAYAFARAFCEHSNATHNLLHLRCIDVRVDACGYGILCCVCVCEYSVTVTVPEPEFCADACVRHRRVAI